MSIYIITHKKYSAPEDPFYKTLLVGAYRGHSFGELFDDVGDNISQKNSSYCELTGIYWIWKHVCDPIIGIVHYRRYFSHDFHGKKILTKAEIEGKLKKYDIIVPFHRTLPTTVKGDYCKESGKEKDLSTLRKVISKKYPQYLYDYDTVMNGNRIFFFNMFICSRELFEQYCCWLFDILFTMEKVTDISGYNEYQKRIYGFISERLFNVWLHHNKLKVFETGVINTEENWPFTKKILTGIKRSVRF